MKIILMLLMTAMVASCITQHKPESICHRADISIESIEISSQEDETHYEDSIIIKCQKKKFDKQKETH